MKFAVLDDKRRGQCWSPTNYADGASARGNAGVEAVSALVFDCDRVPPEEKRLDRVCWIAHTTWSHRPDSPRWRMVLPLRAPVAASAWGDLWRRARWALCPEAHPACKDPGRAYSLPSRPAGVAPETATTPVRSWTANLTRVATGTEGITRVRQIDECQ
jgi:putative DNA primase/helicase